MIIKYGAIMDVRLEYKRSHPDAKLPFRARATDAGYDLYAISNVEIPPHGFANIPTGIHIAPPEGWFYAIEGRSSAWKNGVMTHHGIIDTGYQGEVYVGLYNLKNDPYQIRAGDRIAQMIIYKHYQAEMVEVDEFSEAYSQRRHNGWGSTGR